MTNFGKYAVIEPVKYHLKKEPDWYWIIKPPTAREELEMSRFLNTGPVTAATDGIRRDVIRTNIEIAIEEIVLTFGGTNIPGDDGEPLLSEEAPRAKVREVVQSMPMELILEIWDAIGEALPMTNWGPANPNPTSTS